MKTLVKIMLIMIQLNLSSIFLNGQIDYVFQINKLDNPYPGYLRFDFIHEPQFGLVDNSGRYVQQNQTVAGTRIWYILKNGLFAEFAQTKFYLYNKSLQLVDSIPAPSQYALDFHDFISLSNGRYLMLVNEMKEVDMSKIIEGGDPEAIIVNNILIETDRAGQIYWQWNSLDHLNVTDATPDIDLTRKVIDYAHINSMFEDSQGNILISIRHFDEISLINKSTKEFVWRMGGSYCKNNQFTFVGDVYGGFTGFSHQHTPTILPNGNILLFDNGNSRDNQFSRAVEYSVNYSNKSVSKVWEYRNTPDIYTNAMGSAYRLPNGNTLINWCQGKISEVRPDKSVAFELTYSEFYPVYRSHKVNIGLEFGSALVSGPGDYHYSGSEGNTSAKVSVSQFSGSVMTYMQKHNYPPHISQFQDTVFTDVLPYRWVLSPDIGNQQIIGKIFFKVNNLRNVKEPNKLVVYKRNNEGQGIFQRLHTIYNSSTGDIIADFNGWGEFVLTNSKLDPPNLTYPADDAYISNDNHLSWSHVSGAEKYKVQISKSNKFENIVINTMVQNSVKYDFINLEDNTRYYWRIAAVNYLDTSSWSEVYSFRTNISSPKLKFPLNESFGFKPTQSLRWNKVQDADRYQIQISIDYNFLHSIVNLNNIKDTFHIASLLSNNIEYRWRVRAFRGNDSSQWSAVQTFTTVITTPNLNFPANEELNISQVSNFDWSNSPGAEDYLFELSYDTEFKANVITQKTIFNSIEILNLEYGRKYFWRVKARRPTDSSDWSDIWSFTTKLPPIKLLSPKDNENNVSVETRFTWVKAAEDIRYIIQIANDYYMNDIEVEKDSLSLGFYQVDELKPNTNYYWRVMAYRGEIISEWSDVRTLRTGKGLELVPPRLMLPSNNSTVLSNVSVHWNRRAKALYYNLQLSKNKDFSIVVEELTNLELNYFHFDGLDVGNDYFWRVKAYSKFDSSSWSDPWKFTVIDGLSRVELKLPGNDELQVPLNGKLEWVSAPNVSYYTIQLADDEQFNNPVLFKDVYGLTSANYADLVNNTTYYWRVRYSKSEDISDWSDVWSFTTVTKIVLETPKLQNISNGSTGFPVNGNLEWTKVNYATDYQIALSNQKNFSNIFYKQSRIAGTKLEYTDLDYNTLYFIRVAASNDSARSNWSSALSVTTELEAPKITYPNNGDTNTPKTGAIVWYVKNEQGFYHIQISTDKYFKEIVKEWSNFDYLLFNYDLEYNTTYFCRIKTYNDTNQSRWSETVNFKTKNPASIVNDQTENNKLFVYPNPAKEDINVFLGDLEFKPSEIQVFDVLGNRIYLKFSNFQNQIITANVKDLSAGLYQIRYGSKSIMFIKAE